MIGEALDIVGKLSGASLATILLIAFYLNSKGELVAGRELRECKAERDEWKSIARGLQERLDKALELAVDQKRTRGDRFNKRPGS